MITMREYLALTSALAFAIGFAMVLMWLSAT
jgi:hypothetical protein